MAGLSGQHIQHSVSSQMLWSFYLTSFLWVGDDLHLEVISLLTGLMVAFKLTDLEDNVVDMRNDDQEMQVTQNMQSTKLGSSFHCSLKSRSMHQW
jgi:hypothetical protein